MSIELGPIPRLGKPAIEHVLWSHDSQWIVFSHGPSLWLADAKFRFVRHLVHVEYDEYQLPRHSLIDDIIPIAWTPDNQSIIFMEGYRERESHDWATRWFIKRISIDGTAPPHKIYHNGDSSELIIQPNQTANQLLVIVPSRSSSDSKTQCLIPGTQIAFEHPCPIERAKWVLDDEFILIQTFPHLVFHNGDLISESPNQIQLWDAKTGQIVWELPTRSSLDEIIFSPDGMRICSISLDTTAWVWDLTAHKVLFGLEGFTNPIPHTFAQAFWEKPPSTQTLLQQTQWSSDGRWIGALNRANLFLFWEAATGKQIGQFQVDYNVMAWRWSPDGRYIVTTSGRCDDVVTVYETATGKVVNQLVGLRLVDACLEELVWRPDGTQLLVMQGSTTLKVWDTSDPDPARWSLVLDYYPDED